MIRLVDTHCPTLATPSHVLKSGVFLLFGERVWIECSVELHAGADVEFAVDAAEVDFDGLGADEQCRGDVAVGHS